MILFQILKMFCGGPANFGFRFVANECLDSRMKSGIPSVICKLDIEKGI